MKYSLEETNVDEKKESVSNVENTTVHGTSGVMKTHGNLREGSVASRESVTDEAEESTASVWSFLAQAAEKLAKTWVALTAVGSSLLQVAPKRANSSKALTAANYTSVTPGMPLVLNPNYVNVYNKSTASLPTIQPSNKLLSNTPVSGVTNTKLQDKEDLDNDSEVTDDQAHKTTALIDSRALDASAKLRGDANENDGPYSIEIYHNSKQRQSTFFTSEDRKRFNAMTGGAQNKRPRSKILDIYRTVLEVKDDKSGKTIATFIFKDFKESYMIQYKNNDLATILVWNNVIQHYPLNMEEGLSAAVAVTFADHFDLQELATKLQGKDVSFKNTTALYKDLSFATTPACDEKSMALQNDCYENMTIEAARNNAYNKELTFGRYSTNVSMGIRCNKQIMQDVLSLAHKAMKPTKQYLAMHTPACSILKAPNPSDLNTIEIGIDELQESNPFVFATDELRNEVTNNTDSCALLPDKEFSSTSDKRRCYYNVYSQFYKNMGEGELYDKIMSFVGNKKQEQPIKKNDIEERPAYTFGNVVHDFDQNSGVTTIHNLAKVKSDPKYQQAFKADKNCYENSLVRNKINDVIEDLQDCPPKVCPLKPPVIEIPTSEPTVSTVPATVPATSINPTTQNPSSAPSRHVFGVTSTALLGLTAISVATALELRRRSRRHAVHRYQSVSRFNH